MPDGLKAALPPDIQEAVGLVPSVKAHAIGVGLQYPEQFRKCRVHPMRVIVVGNGAPASVLVPHKVGGIGKNQIRAGVGELPQFLYAIAVYNAVGFAVWNRLLGLGQSP